MTADSISVGFISLGCAKNLVDSQVMAGVLVSENLTLAPVPEAAEVVIVNTCAFIDSARDESSQTIQEACSLKAAGGPCRAVIVTGCMPQRYRETLHDRFPDVDMFLGLDQLEEIAVAVHAVLKQTETPGRLHVSAEARRLYEPRIPGLRFSGGPYAYVKVAEGCDHGCTFCAIPGIRGRHRSRTIDHIVAEADALLATGARELNLISQDITAYGFDLGAAVTLPQLLRRLAALGDGFWIRLLYGYPAHVTDELLETMAELPQVCTYLDVPVQHADAGVLRGMGRADTLRAIREFPVQARRVMPDIVLRTTCLLGFPGEDDDAYSRLLDYLEDVAFDHVGAFVYSAEEGTAALRLGPVPPRAKAEERRDRLLEAQQARVRRMLQSRIGRSESVLLEQAMEDDASVWRGRSFRFAPEVDGVVWVDAGRTQAAVGDIVPVCYEAVQDYDLVGTMCTT